MAANNLTPWAGISSGLTSALQNTSNIANLLSASQQMAGRALEMRQAQEREAREKEKFLMDKQLFDINKDVMELQKRKAAHELEMLETEMNRKFYLEDLMASLPSDIQGAVRDVASAYARKEEDGRRYFTGQDITALMRNENFVNQFKKSAYTNRLANIEEDLARLNAQLVKERDVRKRESLRGQINLLSMERQRIMSALYKPEEVAKAEELKAEAEYKRALAGAAREMKGKGKGSEKRDIIKIPLSGGGAVIVERDPVTGEYKEVYREEPKSFLFGFGPSTVPQGAVPADKIKRW